MLGRLTTCLGAAGLLEAGLTAGLFLASLIEASLTAGLFLPGLLEAGLSAGFLFTRLSGFARETLTLLTVGLLPLALVTRLGFTRLALGLFLRLATFALELRHLRFAPRLDVAHVLLLPGLRGPALHLDLPGLSTRAIVATRRKRQRRQGQQRSQRDEDNGSHSFSPCARVASEGSDGGAGASSLPRSHIYTRVCAPSSLATHSQVSVLPSSERSGIEGNP